MGPVGPRVDELLKLNPIDDSVLDNCGPLTSTALRDPELEDCELKAKLLMPAMVPALATAIT